MMKGQKQRGLGFAEVVFALAVVWGILEIVKAASALWMDIVTIDVDVMAPLQKVAAGYELHRDAGELRLFDPSLGERLLSGLPHLLTGATVLAVGLLLLNVATESRDGAPFTSNNARRLSVAGWIAGIGGMAAMVAGVWSQTVISGNAPEELNIARGVSISFTPLLVAAILIGLAEVFRRGVQMRSELDEVI